MRGNLSKATARSVLSPAWEQDSISAEELSQAIAQGAQGDEDACAVLYHHFSPLLMRLCLGLLGDLQDAEEVTQDAFVYALRNLAVSTPPRSAFPSWLYTIALSRCRNKRRRKLLVQLPLELLSAEAPQAAGPAGRVGVGAARRARTSVAGSPEPCARTCARRWRCAIWARCATKKSVKF